MSKILTEEQKQRRAETARANGRKSKGPVSAAGKHRSSMNAITVGNFVDVHEEDLPAFVTILTAEDRKAYVKLYQSNLRQFRPDSEHELWLVRTLSAEQFQYERTYKLETLSFQEDLEFVANKDADRTPDVLELAAFRRSVYGDRCVRILERKRKSHLAAYEKLVRLLVRIQKDRPLPAPDVDIARKEPSLDSPKKVSQVAEDKEVAPNFYVADPVSLPFLLTDLTESVKFNQQQNGTSECKFALSVLADDQTLGLRRFDDKTWR